MNFAISLLESSWAGVVGGFQVASPEADGFDVIDLQRQSAANTKKTIPSLPKEWLMKIANV